MNFKILTLCLFPSFFIGCQSMTRSVGFNQNNLQKSSPQSMHSKKESSFSDQQNKIVQENNENTETNTSPQENVKVQSPAKLSDLQSKEATYYSTVKFDEPDDEDTPPADEIENTEDLANIGDGVLSDAPNNFDMDGDLEGNLNPLLCHEGVYYQSWAAQYNSQWMALNAKKFKRVSSRLKALNQARMNEFIQLVYPAIEKTGYDFPVVFNPQVWSWISYFAGVGRSHFVDWLERGKYLIPEMESKLSQYGLPSDLVYLSMIESGYKTRAMSSVGAVGPWQFMAGTAKEYGLKINDWVDERRDIDKSTKAAAQYLSDLYVQFGNWHLAAASYNGGPGLVSKTLRKYGETSSFFDLTSKKRINTQTANYVPKILAAMIVAKNASLFGFDFNSTNSVNPVSTIAITRSITLDDLASSIQVDKKILEDLNPQLRLGITPPAQYNVDGKFDLLVPASKAQLAMEKINLLSDAPTNHLVAARIKRYEKVTDFARRYKINVASLLRSNNNLKANSSLRKGQVVYISVALGSGQYDKLTTVKYVSHHHKVHRKYAHHRVHKIKHVAHSKLVKKKQGRIAFAK